MLGFPYLLGVPRHALAGSNPAFDIYAPSPPNLSPPSRANPGEPIMPWQRGGTRPVLPTNAVTGQGYRGVNILSLWVAALERGYESGEWATLRQWNEKGAQVRKGEKASAIVFYKEIAVEAEPEADAAEGEAGGAASRAAIGCSRPSRWRATARPPRCRLTPSSGSPLPRRTSRLPAPGSSSAARRPAIGPRPIPSTCRTRRASSPATGAAAPRPGTPCSATRRRIGPVRRIG